MRRLPRCEGLLSFPPTSHRGRVIRLYSMQQMPIQDMPGVVFALPLIHLQPFLHKAFATPHITSPPSPRKK